MYASNETGAYSVSRRNTAYHTFPWRVCDASCSPAGQIFVLDFDAKGSKTRAWAINRAKTHNGRYAEPGSWFGSTVKTRLRRHWIFRCRIVVKTVFTFAALFQLSIPIITFVAFERRRSITVIFAAFWDREKRNTPKKSVKDTERRKNGGHLSLEVRQEAQRLESVMHVSLGCL